MLFDYSMHFFSIYPPFYACFRALMCTTYSFLSYILHKSFLHLLISVLSAKNGRSLSRVIFYFFFLDIQYLRQEYIKNIQEYLQEYLHHNFL